MESDNSQSMVQSLVNEVKGSVRLDESSQAPKYSGHESAAQPAGGTSAASGGPAVGK